VFVDYWLDELPPSAEAATEEHLIQCVDCARRLERLVQIHADTRDLVGRGRVPLMLTPALLARLEQDGVRIRHHRVEAGGHTRCTAGPDDDLIGVTLLGEFRSGERVDLVYLDAPDSLRERRTDVPVDAERGEVVFVERGDVIRTLPSQRVRLALYGVGPSGERTIGEYTLLHTPWPGARS
jgi:hypothetical protein